MIYIDSNILIYARIDKGETGKACRELIAKMEEGKFVGTTSLLTIDEVVWIVRKEIGYKEGISYARDLISSEIEFLPIKTEDILRSLDLMETGLKPRDSIHASICLNHGIFSILTDDPDFKTIKELEVFGPAEFLKKINH